MANKFKQNLMLLLGTHQWKEQNTLFHSDTCTTSYFFTKSTCDNLGSVVMTVEIIASEQVEAIKTQYCIWLNETGDLPAKEIQVQYEEIKPKFGFAPVDIVEELDETIAHPEELNNNITLQFCENSNGYYYRPIA